MYILLAILMFGFLIFIHELGHFLSAKLLDVQVNEFAICMGPVLWQKKKGETTYSLAQFPSAASARWRERTRSRTIESVPAEKLVAAADHLSCRVVHELRRGLSL